MARSMTKSEFRKFASRAEVNPNAYGLIVNTGLPATCGRCPVGAKVVGITWYDEWVKASRWSCSLGNVDDTHLGKVPYVVLKKGKYIYEVEAWRFEKYLNELLNEMLVDMIKNQSTKASK